jgi:hypothetical protein
LRCLKAHEAILFPAVRRDRQHGPHTACNVPSDLAVTCIVAKSESEMGLLVWGRIGKLVLE